jgi:DNA-binding transcriptional MerR regulator
VCGGVGVRYFERDADLAGHPASDLDLVDVVGLSRIGEFDGGSSGIEQRDPPTVRSGVRGLLTQPQRISIERQRAIVVVDGHDQPQFLDRVHVPILALAPGQPHTVWDVDGLLSVGQLARRAGLTAKALRHYDRIGLLHPALVDAAGYRWYEHAQIELARRIAILRSVDVPIDDVRRCLNSGDVDEVLTTQRRRLEARLTGVQRDLHTLDHLISEGWASPMATKAEPMDPDDERRLAASLFNSTWTLLEKESRARDEDDAMLHMAHASTHHWRQVGTPQNIARGEWQCSRVYATLRRAEPCLHHAQRVLDICQENGLGDFDLAFAYEALARGHAIGGDAEQAQAYTEQALAAAEDIKEDDDRELLLTDLETIPGQSRFW